MWNLFEVSNENFDRQGASTLADSVNDAILIDVTDWVPQDLINGEEFKGKELGIDYKSVLALATVPAEAASDQINKF